MCVESVDDYLVFAACNDEKAFQRWTWSETNGEALERAMKSKFQPGDDPPELDYIQ